MVTRQVTQPVFPVAPIYGAAEFKLRVLRNIGKAIQLDGYLAYEHHVCPIHGQEMQMSCVICFSASQNISLLESLQGKTVVVQSAMDTHGYVHTSSDAYGEATIADIQFKLKSEHFCPKHADLPYQRCTECRNIMVAMKRIGRIAIITKARYDVIQGNIIISCFGWESETDSEEWECYLGDVSLKKWEEMLVY